jgi:hypothetical protein
MNGLVNYRFQMKAIDGMGSDVQHHFPSTEYKNEQGESPLNESTIIQ